MATSTAVAIDTEEQGQNVCFTTSELRQLRKYLLGEKIICINSIKNNTKLLEKLGQTRSVSANEEKEREEFKQSFAKIQEQTLPESDINTPHLG